MTREELIRETRTLMDYAVRGHTSLAATEMELESTVFTDPSAYHAETEALFRHYPLCVGPSCLLREPGEYFTFTDTGVPVVIVRGADRQVRAFLNQCSHRGAPVAVGRGRLKGNLFSCPYHAWTYALDGRLRGVPFQREGFPCLDRERLALRPVPVAEHAGLIFVLANPDGAFDVAEVEAGMGADLRPFGLDDHFLYDTARIPVRQNWKSLMEGYHEFYHFQALHPNTIATMSFNNVGHYRQFGRNHCLSAPKLNIAELASQPESEWQPRNYVSFVYYFFPATVFFVVEDHFQLWRVYPVDAQNSVVYQSLFLPRLPASPEEEARYRDFFNMITKVVIDEDYWLGQMIQQGLDSGIARRMILGRNEIGVQNMHAQIADVMGRSEVSGPYLRSRAET
jgi:phenylpropionate dioxygenase-like ring-hydroxylating dioxygenase large terminal subunit